MANREMTWEIIFAWTGTTDLDPQSRGGNINDARMLYAMEKIWGKNSPPPMATIPGV